MNECREVRKVLAAVAEDVGEAKSDFGLPDDVALHLKSCTECSDFWKTERDAEQHIRSYFASSPELPAGFRSRFTASLKAEAPHRPRSTFIPRRPVAYFAMSAVFICVLAAVWISRPGPEMQVVPPRPAPARLTVPVPLLNPNEAFALKVPDAREAIPGVQLGERMIRNLSAAVRAVTPAKPIQVNDVRGES